MPLYTEAAYSQTSGLSPIPAPIQQIRNPTPQDIQYPLYQLWINTVSDDFWFLASFTSTSGSVLANWKIQEGIGSLTGNNAIAVSSDSLGNINVLGTTGQIVVTGDAPTNTLTLSLAGSGTAIDSINVDANTPPGTDPVAPDINGLITITGAQVATGTVGANVIRTDSLAANSLTLEIQRSTAVAAPDSTKNGVAHFNSSHFSVDASGFVGLTGGGQAIDSFTTTVGGPVGPDGAGNVACTGMTSTYTDGSVANTLRTEVQGTNHALFIGRGANTAATTLGVATDGQLPIGNTGADPTIAALTAGTGISIANGAGSITISTSGTSTLTYTAVATTPYVVLTTDEYLGVNSSGGVRTVQLPDAPSAGRVFSIKDSTGSAATNNITVTTVGGAVNIDGATTFVMNTAYEAITVIFSGTAYEVF